MCMCELNIQENIQISEQMAYLVDDADKTGSLYKEK